MAPEGRIGQTLVSSLLHLVLALASITHRDLGSSTLPCVCNPYYEHFGASNISLIPNLLEVGPFVARTRINRLCHLALPSGSRAHDILSLDG
jgi:hypothetical protein